MLLTALGSSGIDWTVVVLLVVWPAAKREAG
jgi:hypothetical protein